MRKIKIYCTTIKYYKILNKLPNYIIPLGLGNETYPSFWLNEKKGINITELNKFYAEFTGLYWIWKNQTNLNNEDLIGNCHNRVLWLNKLIMEKKNLQPRAYMKIY